MLPPGRAQLETMPVSIGSAAMITMGISRVAASPPSTRDVERHDHIDLEPDQLGRKLRKPIQLSFRRAKIKCNVLPLDIAKFT